MPQREPRNAVDEVERCPTFWFAVMEAAKTKRDFTLAAEAKARLERLGVVVRFRSPHPRRLGGPDRAA
jgi:hypothetical protein